MEVMGLEVNADIAIPDKLKKSVFHYMPSPVHAKKVWFKYLHYKIYVLVHVA